MKKVNEKLSQLWHTEGQIRDILQDQGKLTPETEALFRKHFQAIEDVFNRVSENELENPRPGSVILHFYRGPVGERGARGCEPLNPGDTVRLRSGGPLMTVLEEREGVVRCAWFQGKENREGSFPAVALYYESPAWEK